LEVARQVAGVQFLPVCLGLAIQKFGANWAAKIARPLTAIANGLFVVLIVLACIVGFPLLFKVWGLPLFAIAFMVLFSLGIGHALGGLGNDNRSILAIACIARNVGLALFIAILNDIQQQVLPTLITYLIVGGILGVIYSLWNKRRLSE
jgi:BASS family bile acid:Na+ symporter